MTLSADTRVYLSITGILAIVFLLWLLDALFRREAVKRDLLRRGCQPLRISWRPFAFWSPRYSSTPFRVAYRDFNGRIHDAYCSVYMAASSYPLGSRHVEWLRDELSTDENASETPSHQ